MAKQQIIPSRIVVTEHPTYGLQVRAEVQIPGTALWRPIRASAFKAPESGEIIPFLSVDGISLKRFVASLAPEPEPVVDAARLTTAETAESDI
jgi:hypothetical protein